MGKKHVSLTRQSVFLLCYRLSFCSISSRFLSFFLISLIALQLHPSYSYALNIEKRQTTNLIRDEIAFLKGNEKTNTIPILNNRFRLDANLDEITMVFYRVSGAKPIILIMPDGSKIRAMDYDKEKVSWYDDSNFDMIKIKNPMPGPWQAIGDIKKDSKIFVVSEVKIVTTPLPKLIFKGEVLKVTGTLHNGDNAIDVADFRKVVKLDVYFLSENNKEDDNFAAEPVKVTSFKDNGQLLDERLGDGIFTGEFFLNLPTGMWLPTYQIKLPLASRELQQTAVKIIPPPIELNVTVSHIENIDHKLKIKLLSDFVDIDSIIIEGKIMFPDRQVEHFSMVDGKGNYRHKTIEFTESGIYKINTNVFGVTLDGRDFRLKLSQYTFNVDSARLSENKAKQHGADSQNGTQGITNTLHNLTEEEQKLKEKLLLEKKNIEQQKPIDVIYMAILANTAIIAFGIILYVFFRRKNTK